MLRRCFLGDVKQILTDARVERAGREEIIVLLIKYAYSIKCVFAVRIAQAPLKPTFMIFKYKEDTRHLCDVAISVRTRKTKILSVISFQRANAQNVNFVVSSR